VKWPADKIEHWPVDRLVPYAHNARTHSEAQVLQLAASMEEFGWTTPVLVDETGMIIAGHGRVLAAQKLKLKAVPVIIARGWSQNQKRAFRVADNKLPMNASWDADLLKIELTDLKALGADLSLIGFAEDELADLFATMNDDLTDPDEVPEPLAEAVSSAGDVWLLGGHRLTCGSSTDADTVTRAFGRLSPKLMVTDPPYGVEYDPAWRNRARGNNSKRTGKVENDHRADWREAWALFPGDVAYVWHGALHSTTVAESLTACGFDIRAQVIWAKDRLVLGRGDYHWQHEPCWYAVRGKGHWRGGRKQTTVWQISTRAQDTETVHGTQKPTACMRRPMENNSVAGQAVYDPFSGSGTSIIAAEMCGRVCCAVELSPVYIDVAVRRWQAFSGKEATLEGSGKTFAEIAEERGVACDEVAHVAAG
jgi:DNA modification methylase